ncbi:peptidoglycan bridge formation glycyltransferase FemA/FemB family protein [bacterium]|jgi:lipid II:glycine glycyltransferase (peptidoglycan interpeptide bridge formation enzyme)|nr:peptidoglycan bridge formation glycyltransferase FemA/FemB family protein [bacterium]MBT6293716.1 peptidoglycan bridge formation glycyltransferase FemA/FemB family protein [bacterium]
MKIKSQIITDKKHIQFLNSQNFDIYVQHPNFGKFNHNLGDEYFCFALLKNSKPIISSLCILIKAKRGHFFYLPYGPVYNDDFKDHLGQFFKGLKQIAKEKNISFIRISPYKEISKQNLQTFKKNNFFKAPMHMIAQNTALLDLKNKDEKAILKAMNKNHRNLIRKGLKNSDLSVKVSTDVKDIKKVSNLLQITAKRHNFTPFSQKYLETEFQSFQDLKAGRIYLCYYQEELIAASITYQFGKTKVYKHGASNMKYKNIPASYLIQWHSILDALKDKLEVYNFWGVAPSQNHKDHPFYGITHFKLGFGAKQIDLIPALDMRINFRYIFNWLIETIRRLKRGF